MHDCWRLRFLDALEKLIADEAGQDLVEYALLTAFLAFAGYIVLTALGVDILDTYQSWVDPLRPGSTPTLWDPPPPAGS
jgi:Flp pilus assembly pilin Flp